MVHQLPMRELMWVVRNSEPQSPETMGVDCQDPLRLFYSSSSVQIIGHTEVIPNNPLREYKIPSAGKGRIIDVYA